MIYCARFLDFLKQKKHSRKSRKCLKLLVRPAGFEPRLESSGISLSLNLPTWSESRWKHKKKQVMAFPEPSPAYLFWYARQDSNLRPTDSKSGALSS
jgi:hypothetical protein